MLTRAFYDDPVMCWLQPDPGRRAAGLPGFYRAITRHHFLAGVGAEVAVGSTGIGAAALWDPPGRWQHSAREQAVMLPGLVRAFRGRLAVARALGEEMKAAHPEEPHWYLAIIGSDPSVRGVH